jgi:hypothetical protein
MKLKDFFVLSQKKTQRGVLALESIPLNKVEECPFLKILKIHAEQPSHG